MQETAQQLAHNALFYRIARYASYRFCRTSGTLPLFATIRYTCLLKLHFTTFVNTIHVLCCCCFTPLVCSLPFSRFYSELENASIHRFAKVLGGSFGFSSLLYTFIAVAGFLTFGENTNSYVLNNYSPSDGVATLRRLAIAFSTLLTFPLAFMGFRDGVLDIFSTTPADLNPHDLNALTVALLGMITLIACFVTDLGIINAVTGGFLATAIVFVFPALMYRETVAATLENTVIEAIDEEKEWRLHNEVKLAYALMTAGVALGLIGALEAVQSKA